MRRFTEAEVVEVWERRQAGELTRSIARRLGRNGSSIRRVFEDAGGVRPARRRRATRHLTLVEREEISRGVAGGEPLRSIARRLGRAPSTVSREVARNGGRRRYRAHWADRAASGVGLGDLNRANWRPTDRCVPRLRTSWRFGGPRSRSRVGCGARTLVTRRCTCPTKRSI